MTNIKSRYWKSKKNKNSFAANTSAKRKLFKRARLIIAMVMINKTKDHLQKVY